MTATPDQRPDQGFSRIRENLPDGRQITYRWKARAEWQADAEHAVSTACHPRERVSPRLADWLDPDELRQLGSEARQLRTELTRLIRGLEADPGSVALDRPQLDQTLMNVSRWLATARDRRDEAAERALRDAIAREVARRATDEAWQREQERRRRIDPTYTPS